MTPVAMKMTTNPNRLPFRDYALRQGVRPLLLRADTKPED
jgi:hypothetical protein